MEVTLTHRMERQFAELQGRHGRKKSPFCLCEGVRCCKELLASPAAEFIELAVISEKLKEDFSELEKFATVKVSDEKLLRITIAENLDYTEIFDDIFAKYLKTVTRQRVKTVNMGTMYDLQYIIVMKDVKDEKKMLDEIRCRNGNLTVACGKVPVNTETL